jgi:putative transposase
MTTRKIKFSIDEYYHIYNRGVDKRIIFLDNRDRERFLILIFLSNSKKPFEISKKGSDDWSLDKSLNEIRGEQLVSIGAWCFMPNHFHILLREKTEGGISKFMLKLLTGYSSYFNKKYHRTGALFEGKFKADHTDSDVYLKYIYSYIHLNPIGIIDKGWKKKKIEDKSKAKKFIKKYEYSSYKDYLGEDRLQNKILNREFFPDYFESISKFEEMTNFWIENSEESFKVKN